MNRGLLQTRYHIRPYTQQRIELKKDKMFIICVMRDYFYHQSVYETYQGLLPRGGGSLRCVRSHPARHLRGGGEVERGSRHEGRHSGWLQGECC